MAIVEENRLGIFDAENLSRILRTELEAVWHDIPVSTRAILIGATTSLMQHHINGMLADITAAQLINRLRRNGVK